MGRAVYLQISDDLLREIEEGGLPVGSSIPTIQVLRGQYRTSHVTVLRAFKELADKGIIRKRPGLGYVVAPPAAKVRKLRTLGCLCRSISNLPLDQYFNGIMSVIQRESAAAGIGLYFSAAAAKTLLDGRVDFEAVIADAEAMSGFVDGFFADSLLPDECVAKIMQRTGKSVVVVNRPASEGITAVYPGVRTVLEKMYAALHRLGYDFFACCDSGEDDYFNKLRLNVHAEAMEKFRVAPGDSRIMERFNFLTLEERQKKLVRMLCGTNRKRVFLAPSDNTAWGIFLGLREAGFEVRKDYGLVGFFGLDSSSLVPELTTVRVDTGDLGRKAFAALMNLTAGREIRQGDLLGNAELQFGETV